MYKTEMHCHSAHVSTCARATADVIIEKYLEAGYTTIVSTEHLNDDTFSPEQEAGNWQDRVTHYMQGYYNLLEAAKGRINVLFGGEFRLLHNNYSDYLVYGLTEKFLREIDDPRYLPKIYQMADLFHEHGLMIFQAHPFRANMMVTEPTLLDGIEIANLSPWHESFNDIAQLWAKRNNLIGITGTDFHNPEHTPLGGIETDFPITDNEILLKTLRERNFTPIMGK